MIEEESLESFGGIKRHSAVSDVAEVFHLRVPVDYMHQVFVGFTSALLFVVRNKTCKSDLVEIFNIVLSNQLTLDFKQALGSLEDSEFFKANALQD